jgi:cytochrome c-type biogenesis protein CcmH
LKPRRVIAVCVLLSLAFSVSLAEDTNARFSSLGHKMICGCGCNQILLECNHVGCPLSDGMRNELTAALQRGDSDSLILQAFVQKYGPTILAAPTGTGFDRVAWITPFAVLLLGLAAAVAIIRSWRGEPVPAGAASREQNDLVNRVRRETDL